MTTKFEFDWDEGGYLNISVGDIDAMLMNMKIVESNRETGLEIVDEDCSHRDYCDGTYVSLTGNDLVIQYSTTDVSFGSRLCVAVTLTNEDVDRIWKRVNKRLEWLSLNEEERELLSESSDDSSSSSESL